MNFENGHISDPGKLNTGLVSIPVVGLLKQGCPGHRATQWSPDSGFQGKAQHLQLVKQAPRTSKVISGPANNCLCLHLHPQPPSCPTWSGISVLYPCFFISTFYHLFFIQKPGKAFTNLSLIISFSGSPPSEPTPPTQVESPSSYLGPHPHVLVYLLTFFIYRAHPFPISLFPQGQRPIRGLLYLQVFTGMFVSDIYLTIYLP